MDDKQLKVWGAIFVKIVSKSSISSNGVTVDAVMRVVVAVVIGNNR